MLAPINGFQNLLLSKALLYFKLASYVALSKYNLDKCF